MKTETKATFISFFGHIYEHFESSIFTFSGIFVASYFFAEGDNWLSRYGVYIAISSGFFMAPFGAFIFSWIGDKLGRRPALITAYTVVVIPSILLPFIPNYTQIGVSASFLLIFCRLFQGLGAGGSFTGRIVFLSEATVVKKNLNMGLLISMGFWGALLGTGLSSYFMQETIGEWGWKIPYILAASMGIVLLLLRKYIHETDPWLQEIRSHAKIPLFEAFRQYRYGMVVVLLFGMALLMPFYVVASWLGSYLQATFDLTATEILTTSSHLMIISGSSIILISIVSTFMSLRLLLFIGALLLFPLGGLLYHALSINSLKLIHIAQYCIALHLGCITTPIMLIAQKLFPARYRYSGFSVPFAVGQALTTGTTPLLAEIISYNTGKPANASLLIDLSSVFLLLAVWILKKHTPKQMSHS